MAGDYITFTPSKLKNLKEAYRTAVEAHQDSFWFDGSEVLTSYAKYMIEYLDMQFKRRA